MRMSALQPIKPLLVAVSHDIAHSHGGRTVVKASLLPMFDKIQHHFVNLKSMLATARQSRLQKIVDRVLEQMDKRCRA